MPRITPHGIRDEVTTMAVKAEMRQQGRLPRQRLRVTILGGDWSEAALGVQRRPCQKLQILLRASALSVTSHVQRWVIQAEEQTTALLIRWGDLRPRRTASAGLLANCSGFLSQRVKACKHQLPEILRHAGRRTANVLWIEPMTKPGTYPRQPHSVTDQLSANAGRECGRGQAYRGASADRGSPCRFHEVEPLPLLRPVPL